MSEHKVFVKWKREKEDFSYQGYDRTHTWKFEGGTEIVASAATHFLGKHELVNPEEAYAASLSSCHMLTFLAIASRKRIIVNRYEDNATAILAKNDKGRLVITKIYLKPKIEFGGEKSPSMEEIESMHHLSHEECFIAGSVLTEIIVEPVY